MFEPRMWTIRCSVHSQSLDTGVGEANWRNIAISLTDLGRGPLAKNCCDKNVIVPCSERVRVEQNGSERISGNWLKNQVE
jgi:hypothetical protein